MRILVAESDPLLRRFLVRALGILGHDAVEVESLRALACLSRRQMPRVVLCGARFSDGDGIGVCRELRRTKKDLAVVIMAGDPDGAERADRAALGAVLRKPFGLAELKGVLASF